MSISYKDSSNTIIETITGTNSINIPNKVTKILSNSTKSSSITSIIFEENSQLQKLDIYAFAYSSSLQSIDMRECNLLSTLPIWCFRSCTKLSSIKLPSNGKLSTIKSGAFTDCDGLVTLVIPQSVCYFDHCTFDSGAIFHMCKSLRNIYFPEESKCTQLGSLMFYGCESFESFVVPPLVNELPKRLFDLCNSLRFIVIFSTNPIDSSTIFHDIQKNYTIFIYVSSYQAQTSFIDIGINKRNIIIIGIKTSKYDKKYLIIPNLLLFVLSPK